MVAKFYENWSDKPKCKIHIDTTYNRMYYGDLSAGDEEAYPTHMQQESTAYRMRRLSLTKTLLDFSFKTYNCLKHK